MRESLTAARGYCEAFHRVRIVLVRFVSMRFFLLVGVEG
jgi:hypothetical protein